MSHGFSFHGIFNTICLYRKSKNKPLVFLQKLPASKSWITTSALKFLRLL